MLQATNESEKARIREINVLLVEFCLLMVDKVYFSGPKIFYFFNFWDSQFKAKFHNQD
jgi:hypothetical protein